MVWLRVSLTAWTLSDVQSMLKSTPVVLFLFLFTRALIDSLVAVGLKFEQRCSHFKHRLCLALGAWNA